MQVNSRAPFRAAFALVFPFHATSEIVAEMVTANVDRRRERVTREEIQSLFGAELN